MSLSDSNFDEATEIIKAHVLDADWRQTILFVIEEWGIRRGQRRVAGEIVRSILNMKSEQELMGQNVILAGHCLIDVGERGIGSIVAHEIQQGLFKIVSGNLYQTETRNDAGSLLGRSGWLPYDLDDWVTIHRGKYLFGQNNQTEIIERNFAVGKYSITNTQYRKFIEEDCYSRREFWTNTGWEWLKKNKSSSLYWDDITWNNPLAPVIGVSPVWHRHTAIG